MQRDSREGVGACQQGQHLLGKSNNAYLNFWFFSVGDPDCVTDVVDVCSGLSHAKDETPYLQPADKQLH